MSKLFLGHHTGDNLGLAVDLDFKHLQIGPKKFRPSGHSLTLLLPDGEVEIEIESFPEKYDDFIDQVSKKIEEKNGTKLVEEIPLNGGGEYYVCYKNYGSLTIDEQEITKHNYKNLKKVDGMEIKIIYTTQSNYNEQIKKALLELYTDGSVQKLFGDNFTGVKDVNALKGLIIHAKRVFEKHIKQVPADDLIPLFLNIQETYTDETELIKTSYKGRTGIVQTLLENGADPNIQNGRGGTALTETSGSDLTEAAWDLLENEALKNKIDLKDLTKDCSDDYTTIVQRLIIHKADVNHQDKFGRTALMYASETGHPDVVQMLLNRGADLTIKDKNGKTALMYASETGHPVDVQMLLDHGADLTIKDKNGKTVLMYASQIGGHPDVVQMLLNRGADRTIEDKNGKTALMYAKNNKIKREIIAGMSNENPYTKKRKRYIDLSVRHRHGTRNKTK